MRTRKVKKYPYFFMYSMSVTCFIVIAMGGLKSSDLAQFTFYSVHNKDICLKDIPTIRGLSTLKGCLHITIHTSQLQMSLIWGISFIPTKELQVDIIHKGCLWYRTAQFLRGGEPQYNPAPQSQDKVSNKVSINSLKFEVAFYYISHMYGSLQKSIRWNSQ